MKKYRKKPVVVEAVQWTGNNEAVLKEFCGNSVKISLIREPEVTLQGLIPKWAEVKIKTLEGVMRVDIGSYIIKGIQGEFYPCKPDIFELTYEECDG